MVAAPCSSVAQSVRHQLLSKWLCTYHGKSFQSLEDPLRTRVDSAMRSARAVCIILVRKCKLYVLDAVEKRTFLVWILFQRCKLLYVGNPYVNVTVSHSLKMPDATSTPVRGLHTVRSLCVPIPVCPCPCDVSMSVSVASSWGNEASTPGKLSAKGQYELAYVYTTTVYISQSE